MNRSDSQTLAELRVKEVRVLLENQCYEGAYYLIGYAVECALKSCVAKQINQYDFPDLKLIRDSYTHDLVKLLSISGLKLALEHEVKANQTLAVNWSIVTDWSEETRYNTEIDEIKARDLFIAVTSNSGGILPWLKTDGNRKRGAHGCDD